MRYYVTGSGVGVTYPDRVIFAFMPNIVSVANLLTADNIDLIVENVSEMGGKSKQITVPIVGGAASVDISHIIQALFAGRYNMQNAWPVDARCIYGINIKINANGREIFSADNADHRSICIWGSLDPFGRLGEIGTMPYNADRKEYQRTVRWFKNFPFTIEALFGYSSLEIDYSNDGGETLLFSYSGDSYLLDELLHNDTWNDDQLADSLTGRYFSDIIIKPWNDENVWDATFDYTFAAYDMSVQQHIRVNMDYREEGHYLRWIDINGIICYYLFAEGSDSVKTSDKGTMAQAITGGGMQYNDGARVYGKTRERSMKICATLVPEDEQKLVQGIGSAVLCDLYVGKDANGNDLWLPVVPKSGTLSIKENQGLQDIEVEIQLPSGQIQRL